jgi:methionyl-tRNA formyltransferase
MMRIVWVGFHVEGLPALRGLLEQGVPVAAVLTLEPEQAAKRSGVGNYEALCADFGVPLHRIKNINDEASIALLQALSPDVVFVIGWSQIVRGAALRTARLGMIGAHASLLPRNRGRAPINWALINGLSETGNSLIWLAEHVDEGDLIAQTRFAITPYDTCATLYDKVAVSNREMILSILPQLAGGERPGVPQPPCAEPLLPGRKPEDGVIDWSKPSQEVYNFVRALVRPYPGAFSWLEGQRWFIQQCAWLPGAAFPGARSGEIIGSLYSPTPQACGLIVACGAPEAVKATEPPGGIVLLELENEQGDVLTGQVLSEQPWAGKIWSSI